MRKIKYYLLLFCFLLIGSSQTVRAQIPSFSVQSSPVHASASGQTALKDREALAAKAIYECIAEFNTKVDLYQYKIPYSARKATSLFDSALEQDLYLFNILANVGDFSDGFCSCYTKNGYIRSFEFDYGIYDASTLKDQYAKLKTTTEKIVRRLKLSNLSDEQAVLAVHDYIALHTNYDTSSKPKRKSYSAYGALVEGKAVCSGYSTACELLLDAKGIATKIVTSDTMDHAWNMVKLGKYWYHMDITWDDPYPSKSDYVSYRFFLKTDKEMKNDKKSPHYGWNSSGIQCNSELYSRIPSTDNNRLYHGSKYWYMAVKGKSGLYTYYRYNFKFTSKRKLMTSHVQPKKYQSRIYYASKKNQIASMNINATVKRNLRKLSSFSTLSSLSIKNNTIYYNYKYIHRNKSGTVKLTSAMKKTTAAITSAESDITRLTAPISAGTAAGTSISTTYRPACASISRAASINESQINALFYALKNYKQKVNLKKYKIRDYEMQALLDAAFTKDYYVQDSISWISVTPVSFSGKYISVLEITYKYKKATMQKRYNALKDAVKKAKETIGTDLSEEEAVLAIHDYIIQNASFNTSYAKKVENNPGMEPDYTYHSAYGVLCKKSGVCSGYAYAYRILLKEYGISSIFIESKAMNHGWNMVKLGKNWYHVDVTWDDPDANAGWKNKTSGDLIYYTFFLLNNKEISANDHYNWSPYQKSSSTIYSNMPRNSSKEQFFYQGSWYRIENKASHYSYVKYDMKGNKTTLVTSMSPIYKIQDRIIYQPDSFSLFSMNPDGSQVRSLTEQAAASGIPDHTPYQVTESNSISKTIKLEYSSVTINADGSTLTSNHPVSLILSDYDLRTTDYASKLTLSKTRITLSRAKSFTLKATVGPNWPLLTNKVTFRLSKSGSRILKLYRVTSFSCKVKGLKKGTANILVQVPHTSLRKYCQVTVK